MPISIQRARIERAMKQCPQIRLTFEVKHAIGVPDAYRAAAHIFVYLGDGLSPPQPYALDDEGVTALVRWRLTGRTDKLWVPYYAVVDVEPFFPPDQPGTPAHLRRAA